MKMVVRLIPIMTMVLLVAALSASPVLADPGHGKGDGGHGGGKGNGNGGNGTQSSASLSVESAEAVITVGDDYNVSGAGFYPSAPVSIVLSEPYCCRFFNVWSDANGNVAFQLTAYQAGTYNIDASQQDGKKLTLMASVSFPVAE